MDICLVHPQVQTGCIELRCCPAIQFHGKHFSTLPYLLPPPALFNWGFPAAWPTSHKIPSSCMLRSGPQSTSYQTGFKHGSDPLLSTWNVQPGFCDLGASWDNSTSNCSCVSKAYLCINFTITPQLPFKGNLKKDSIRWQCSIWPRTFVFRQNQIWSPFPIH